MGIIIINFIAVSIIAVWGFIKFAPQFGQKPLGKDLERIKKSSNYIKDRFKGGSGIKGNGSLKIYLKTLAETAFPNGLLKPKSKLPSEKLSVNLIQEGPYLTWFGHSTFLYEISGKKVLFDPMLTDYASPIPFLVKRYDYDLPATVDDLPEVEFVIVSHDHYDHLDYKTIKEIDHKVGKYLVPLGVGSHLKSWGVPPGKIIEFDWHDEFLDIDSDIKIRSVPSKHFSGRSIDDRYKTLWSAWIIENDNSRVFFGGDSGYFDGFKEIGKKYGPFDLTLLDSAQYHELWKESHMVPEQSVKAHKDLNGSRYMPIHWAAFTLSTHEWTEPIERAMKEAEKENVKIITPKIGQRFGIFEEAPEERWWRGL